jgi:hypothetical protein
MPVFPAFGPPVGASFQEAPPNNLLRSPMDVGPAKVRRRTTANVRVIGMTYMLNSDQMVTLDSFYEKRLRGWRLELQLYAPAHPGDRHCTLRGCPAIQLG